jgi:hypothetical protein
MLRSMFIGLAVAALLQWGARTVASTQGVELAAEQIDWVQIQSQALTHLIADGYTLLMR